MTADEVDGALRRLAGDAVLRRRHRRKLARRRRRPDGTLPTMIVRRELPADEAATRAVQAAAFRRGDAAEPVEARLLDELRADAGWLPRFSLLAEDDGVVVGHVVCTRGDVDGAPVLGLGPIGVHPDRQRRGIGHALVHATIGAAEALDEPVIALLGSPDYYRQFGFVPASRVGIGAPDAAWGDNFQALPLTAFAGQRGRFRYATPFESM